MHADDQKVLSAPQSAPSKPAASPADSPSAKDTHVETGTKPKVRGHNQRSRVLLLRGAVLAILGIALVLFARLLTSLDGVQAFLHEYPGEYELPSWAPTGIPTWLAWQHFFNVFLIVLIVKTGLQIRGERRPPAYWASRRKKDPRKISVTIWFHQAMDLLWVTNGFLFVILLFGTGQWIRIVPSSLEVFPNALSALLQYISLDWPTENGWVNYNSLQQLSYFTTVFVAAPLAVLTGIRMSHLWPAHPQSLSRIYRIELARVIHFPVMLYFCAFTVVHVLLVLMTGALRNLNHMYGGQDSTSWTGFWILLASLVVIVGGFFAARPLITTSIASLFGKVSR